MTTFQLSRTQYTCRAVFVSVASFTLSLTVHVHVYDRMTRVTG